VRKILGLLIFSVGVLSICAGPVGATGRLATDYKNTDALARKLGCKGYSRTPNADKEIGTWRQGTCTYYGEDVTIYLFRDSDQARNWVKAASVFCGAFFDNFPVVNGGTWIISPESKTVAKKIQRRTGGRNQSIKCKS